MQIGMGTKENFTWDNEFAHSTGTENIKKLKVMNKFENFADVTNFISKNHSNLPRDERGFIDWELLEKDGHV